MNSKKGFHLNIVYTIKMLGKKGAYKRVHTTRSYCSSTHKSRYFDYEKLYSRIIDTKYEAPHQSLILATHCIDPGFTVLEIDLIALAILDLLIRYVFSSVEGYCKFNMIFTLVDKDGKDLTYNICNAIPLTPLDGSAFFPLKDIFLYIYRDVIQVFEKYKGVCITTISLRIFITDKNHEIHFFSKDEIIKVLDALFEDLSHDYKDDDYKDDGYGKQLLLSKVFYDKVRRDVKPPVAKPISNKKRTYNSNILQILSSN